SGHGTHLRAEIPLSPATPSGELPGLLR
ncbi:MAG: hypothetical protein QOK49_2319, partial [Baekduia sp.]|nr:hypothetical protein [Baekduia sp.]